MKYWLFIHSQW